MLPSGQRTDWEPLCRECHSVFLLAIAKGDSGANPLFTPDEFAYQIQATKASVIITHPESLSVALAAARATELPAERIILFNVNNALYDTRITVQDVIDEGLANTSTFQERVLQPGEGRTKVAFLNFSSGTTGRPKVWVLAYRRGIPLSSDLYVRLLRYPTMHR